MYQRKEDTFCSLCSSFVANVQLPAALSPVPPTPGFRWEVLQSGQQIYKIQKKCILGDPDCFCLATCRALYDSYLMLSWMATKIFLLLDLNLILF